MLARIESDPITWHEDQTMTQVTVSHAAVPITIKMICKTLGPWPPLERTKACTDCVHAWIWRIPSDVKIHEGGKSDK
jgi:hypothetical protein